MQYGTLLIQAVRDQNPWELIRLLNDGADPNEQDEAGFTALHHAVFTNHLPSVLFLIEHNHTNINATDEMGCTPLFYAQSQDIILVLLDKGARINAQNFVNMTPLHSKVNNCELTYLLLEFGARHSLPDSYGYTPYDYACNQWSHRGSTACIVMEREGAPLAA